MLPDVTRSVGNRRGVSPFPRTYEAQERASIAEREVERDKVWATRYSLSFTRDFVLF